MVKKVHTAGIRMDTALVSLGWFSFVAGLFIPDPIVKAILVAIARVLPKALHGSGCYFWPLT